MGAHLRGCSTCAADALGRVQMKRSVQMAGKRYAGSAEFRNKIAKSVAAKPRRESGWAWRILAVPALLLLILSVGVNLYVGRQKTRRERVYSELADLHVSALASATPVDVISTDRHTVKPWFQGKTSLQLQSAGTAGHGVHAARRARHVSRADAGGAFDLPDSQARDFCIYFSGSRG